MISEIKLLTIDLDDTLWPCMPTIMHAEQTSYNWLQQHLPKITQAYSIEGLRDKRRQLMHKQPELMNDLSEARKAHFKELSNEFDYEHDWIEEGFKVFHDARQKVEFYEDVLPALDILKKHFTLVALTNGNAVIDKVGLTEFFELQISAADVSAAKPDPAMFIEAMKQMDATPDETLHIGDHATHDIQGAINAGIRCVWVNRDMQAWEEDNFRADFEVSDLLKLVEMLGIK